MIILNVIGNSKIMNRYLPLLRITVTTMSIFQGQVYTAAEVVACDDMHYYLEHDDCSIADIVMPLTKATRPLKIGDKVDCTVEQICIAADGHPGAFVRM